MRLHRVIHAAQVLSNYCLVSRLETSLKSFISIAGR